MKHILIIIFLIVQLANAQTNVSFEAKLNAFRYSLYKDLIRIDSPSLLDLTKLFIDSTLPIYKKGKKFYNDNYSDILNFQKNKLITYLHTNIDFQNTNKDSFAIPLELSLFEGFFTAMGYINNYNPILSAEFLKNSYLSRNYGITYIGKFFQYNRIAQPLVKTEDLKNGEWKIILDEYVRIFVFKFTLSSNKIGLQEVWNRKIEN